MKKTSPLILVVLLLFSVTALNAQLYKVDLTEKVNSSSLIVEGKVIARKCFWNPAHTMIFTANTIQVYKIFKGVETPSTIEVMTQGGSVDGRFVDVSDMLTLNNNQTGLFFCSENSINLRSPNTGNTLYDVYGSDQGFLRYDFINNRATAPFATYNDIEGSLYPAIEQQTGQSKRVVNAAFSVAAIVQGFNKKKASTVNGTSGVINSFSPTTVDAGALEKPSVSTLTIAGSGFGAVPSGPCGINFTDANDDDSPPDYYLPYNSPYFVSWSDTKIVVKVPTRAATGFFSVVLSDSSVVTSSQPLTVYFSVLNFEFTGFTGSDTTAVLEPRLMDVNGSGGYNYSFSTSTAGGGKNIATDAASSTFGRAIATWQGIVGANLTNAGNTTVQAVADDNVDVLEFDNKNTGMPVMSAGVLEVTYSWGSVCYNSLPFAIYTAQKSGFDILIRNPGVSTGSTITFEDGPCFPVLGATTYDLESIVLHEMGHALNLAHINDGYQAYPAYYQNVNPEKVMHYAILDYVDRRSPDNSAYTGALYTTTPQHDFYGSCGLYASEMSPLLYTPINNDECPATFPSVPTTPGTLVNFDLVHATSNELKDPAFTQVSCNGQGTEVTNNAWYVVRTTALSNGTLTLNVSGYATTPSTLTSCSGQGVRLAVYDVNGCPAAGSFPPPINCTTFTGNGSLTSLTGLAANQTYLLYFDGIRNTKANFNVSFGGSALPVVISQLSGAYVKGEDDLNIQVQQSINVKEIDVEKSADGESFSALGSLQPSVNGFEGNYTYIDPHPFVGSNFYRLRIINNDGSFDYSNVILVKNTQSRLVYIYPNPVKDNLSISLSGIPYGLYNFVLYDVSGKALSKNQYAVSNGYQTISMPVQGVAAGVYILKISNTNGEQVSLQKIVKE